MEAIIWIAAAALIFGICRHVNIRRIRTKMAKGLAFNVSAGHLLNASSTSSGFSEASRIPASLRMTRSSAW